MSSRFSHSAVKTVTIPDEYPAQHMVRGFGMMAPPLAQALAMAAALEQQYETLTHANQAGGSGAVQRAFATVEVEDQLMAAYTGISSLISGPATAPEQARAMMAETNLLATHRAKTSGKQH